jgi:hypothetical protein
MRYACQELCKGVDVVVESLEILSLLNLGWWPSLLSVEESIGAMLKQPNDKDVSSPAHFLNHIAGIFFYPARMGDAQGKYARGLFVAVAEEVG